MLILASSSPRRKEILLMLGYEFEIRASDCDETVQEGLSPEEIVCLLAKKKANAVEREADDVVLGSDTIVVLNKKIYGKPVNEADAVNMLTELSGQVHTVYTGVCVLKNNIEITNCISAQVCFKELSQAEITEYVKTTEPLDKAGSYAVQGRGSAFVEWIKGDFFTVMGLPACYTNQILRELGILPKVNYHRLIADGLDLRPKSL